MRISIELVPRTEEDLRSQLTEVGAFPRVDTVNIPDISRFPIRSWQGCVSALAHVDKAIPHLRAIDVDLDRPLAAAPDLGPERIGEVLVVAGDAPVDMSRPVYPTTSVDLIRKLRREHPEVTVHAAFDPYRQGFQAERAYALQKIDAGAKGLFTQPFFDVRLMEIFGELLEGMDIFWGVTTVTSRRSQQYWQSRNRAVFPADFEPTLKWNRRLARDALAFTEIHGGNIYFMPIRTRVSDYLTGIL
jgi:methylenetetrahydrofolate reductase (NADPH)